MFPFRRQPTIAPNDVGRILGVGAFSPRDIVFLNDETPRFIGVAVIEGWRTTEYSFEKGPNP